MGKNEGFISQSLYHGMYSRSICQEGSVIMTKQSRSMGSSSVQNKTKNKDGKKEIKREQIKESSAPASLSYRVKSGEPLITSSRNSKRIRHRELVVSSILGATTFTVQNYLQLNPGLATTFPWLSNEAGNWEQYTVHGLQAQYIPIAPTNTQGDVLLSPEYDASDLQPSTEVQAANSKDSVMDSCWRRIDCTLNSKSMMSGCSRKFVRTSAKAGDIKTFDVGRLAVCVNNSTATPSFGKLFLDYDIEFFVPQNSPDSDSGPISRSQFTRGAAQTFTTTVAEPIQWTAGLFDPLGVGLPVAGVFTPPAGVYLIEVYFTIDTTLGVSFAVVVQILKNGATFTPNYQGLNDAVQTQGQMLVRGIIPCNGSDTVQIQVTATGTGVITYVAASGSVMFSLV